LDKQAGFLHSDGSIKALVQFTITNQEGVPIRMPSVYENEESKNAKCIEINYIFILGKFLITFLNSYRLSSNHPVGHQE
jgi:hypothetical protein